jgi:hypothetical protein
LENKHRSSRAISLTSAPTRGLLFGVLAALALLVGAPRAAEATSPNDLSQCGGYGQRACCVLEAFPSCDTGFTETGEIVNPTFCTGLPVGRCGNANPNNLSTCGGDGQPACCLGEGSAPCDTGNIELNSKSGTCPEPISFPGGRPAPAGRERPVAAKGSEPVQQFPATAPATRATRAWSSSAAAVISPADPRRAGATSRPLVAATASAGAA